MSLRPLAPGSQPRKWSNDRFSIISTITCSMPVEPRGDSAVAALAAVWDKNSAPVMAAPVEAPMSWRKVRRVSIRASMRSASERRQGPTDTHSCRIRLAVAAWFPPGCSPVSERCVAGERPAALDEKEAVGYPRAPATAKNALPSSSSSEPGSTHTSLPGSHRASWATWSANRDGAIDRHGVAEQVKNGAMLIDCCRKLLVALGCLRPGDAYLDPDSRETGPHAVVEPEKPADVEVSLDLHGELVEGNS